MSEIINENPNNQTEKEGLNKMNKIIHGCFVTKRQLSSNCMDDTEGNRTNMKKCNDGNHVFTLISAPSVKMSMRKEGQRKGYKVNRKWDEALMINKFDDAEHINFQEYIDDVWFGFMVAKAAAEENEPEPEVEVEDDKKKRKKNSKPKGTCEKRRGIVSFNWAKSLVPFTTPKPCFMVASPGASAASKTDTNPLPWSREMHNTEYQMPFTYDTGDPLAIKFIPTFLDLLVSIPSVGGGNANNKYYFNPESIIFRYTDEACSKINYIFNLSQNDEVVADELVRLIKAKDIKPEEIFIGGKIAQNEELKSLIPSDNLSDGILECKDKFVEVLSKDFKF